MWNVLILVFGIAVPAHAQNKSLVAKIDEFKESFRSEKLIVITPISDPTQKGRTNVQYDLGEGAGLMLATLTDASFLVALEKLCVVSSIKPLESNSYMCTSKK